MVDLKKMARDRLKKTIERRIRRVMTESLNTAEGHMLEEEWLLFRSKILDCGNDQTRMILSDLEDFNIEFSETTEIMIAAN